MFLNFIVLLVSIPCALSTTPNIILVVADDLGFADLNPTRTPHILSMSQRLNRFYSTASVCTPSRISILTGKFPLRYDVTDIFNDRQSQYLPSNIPTLPKLLKSAGYFTAHVGKWHLGGLYVNGNKRDESAPGPKQHGFDHYLTQIEDITRTQLGNRVYRDGGTILLRNDIRVPRNDTYFNMHMTDIIGDETIRLIKSAPQPFFLNIWHLAPHAPYEPAPEPFLSLTAAPNISTNQHYFRSMITHLDSKVGQILQIINASNTLVIFTSDNGGAWEGNVGGLKGAKTDLHEGGIRVPFLVSKPLFKKNVTGSLVDLLPTLCNIANIKYNNSDGIDLFDENHVRSPLFFMQDNYPKIQAYKPKPKPIANQVVIDGPWKLLLFNGQPTELFNIHQDTFESNNLIKFNNTIVKYLSESIRKNFITAPRIAYWQTCDSFSNSRKRNACLLRFPKCIWKEAKNICVKL